MMKQVIAFAMGLVFIAMFDLSAQSMSSTIIISVDAVEAMPGDRFSIPIRFSNGDFDIAGLVIPLRVNHPDLTFDSVTFEGTVKPEGIIGVVFPDLPAGTVRVSYLPNISNFPLTTISVSQGLIANLWLSLSNQAVPGNIKIDSVNNVIDLSDSTQIWTRIEAIDSTGVNFFLPQFEPGLITVRIPTGIDDDSGDLLPTTLELKQNYPNPFNPSTVIRFSLPRAGRVELSVFNVLGQLMADLVDGSLEAGEHEILFDAMNLPSGVYFYRLSHDGTAETKKMMLVK